MAEHQIVDLAVAGSNPASHPFSLLIEHGTCAYGLAPNMQHFTSEHGMRIAATDLTGEVRAIERVDDPFFVGTLYQPQLRSTPGAPHPVFIGLLDAAQAAM